MYNYNDTVISVIIEYIEKNYRNASLEEAASLTHMNLLLPVLKATPV